jgi:phosphinothricin acetyltransferase
MTVHQVDSKDFDEIARIYNCYLGKGTMDLNEKSGAYFRKIVKKQANNEGFYIGKINDKIIGWGIIKQYSDREGYAYTCETSVFLDPDERGKGFGKILKSHLIDECKRMGYKHLVAKIWADNDISIQYNLNLGYSVVGRQEKIGYVEGRWVDVVIMQYVFED